MRILIVDDHPDVRQSLGAFIEQLGHQAFLCHHAPDAVAMARREQPDLVLSDLRMPTMDGLQLFSAFRQLEKPPPFALMTAFGDADTAITALRHGAVDYLRKPIDVRELHRLIERLEASGPSTISVNPAPTVREEADGLIIHGDTFARLVDLADRLHRAKELPCLIEGETGSGKELIARRIHHGGEPRMNQPFIAINCAAISPGLFEAELFGYASGSFTGALSGGAQGKLALAAGGTLLLDELADLPNDQQAKLLRVLEDRTWYPVGSNQLQTLKARVICACNADLVNLVSKGHFREDLYYRLKVGHIRIPPLRERREDIEALATTFMQRIRRVRGRGFQRLSSEAARLLTAYHWPGNIRQLHHLLEELGMLNDGAVLDERLVRERLLNPEPHTAAIPEIKNPAITTSDHPMILPEGGFDLDTWTRKVLTAALDKHQGSPVRTADYLGVTRKVLYTLRKRHGLFEHEGKDESP